ncbi:hypothetical protein [Halorussus sp. AFM4]
MTLEAIGQVILAVTVLGGLAFREQVVARIAALDSPNQIDFGDSK